MPDTPARPELPDAFSIDACESAFVEHFCPYKGNPDPIVVWRAAWEACCAQARAELIAEMKPIAWATSDEEGEPNMLFPSRSEAESYCDDDEEPIALCRIPSTKEGHE